MKKLLLLLVPLLVFISCADDDAEEEGSSFEGTWNMVFTGEYENADCTGDLDSTGWYLLVAFGGVFTLEIEGDTYTFTLSVLGESETESGTFSEENGNPCLDGDCVEATWITEGQSFSINSETDEEYCEDWDTGEELSEYTDQSTCEDAGHTWYGPNCTIEVWEKQ